jgi:hypothetical protein
MAAFTRTGGLGVDREAAGRLKPWPGDEIMGHIVHRALR